MKTIIVYASKYGATKEVAHFIHQQVKDAKIVDINDYKEDISMYQNIILGSKTNVGQVDKRIKELYHTINLTTQQVTIFIVGLQKEQLETVIEQNFSKEVINKSYFVGGKLNFAKMNIVEKTIIKMINKKEKMIDGIDTKRVYDFLDYQEIEKMINKIKEE